MEVVQIKVAGIWQFYLGNLKYVSQLKLIDKWDKNLKPFDGFFANNKNNKWRFPKSCFFSGPQRIKVNIKNNSAELLVFSFFKKNFDNVIETFEFILDLSSFAASGVWFWLKHARKQCPCNSEFRTPAGEELSSFDRKFSHGVQEEFLGHLRYENASCQDTEPPVKQSYSCQKQTFRSPGLESI